MAELEAAARAALGPVGAPELGEWIELGQAGVFHLRRRLTPREQQQAKIDAVCDVRGTPEHTRRIAQMRPFLPPAMREWPDERFP